MMRKSVMLGTALMVVGGTVFLRELSAPARYEGPKPGGVSSAGPSPIVPWAMGLTVLAGLVLVTTGTRRRAQSQA